MPSTSWHSMVTTWRDLPFSLRKTNLARLLARCPEGIFVAPFGQGEIGPDLFRAVCNMGLEGLVSKRGIDRIGAAGRHIGSKSRTEAICR